MIDLAANSQPARDETALCATVQFVLPRRALAAINPLAIIAKARRDGVENVRLRVTDGARADEIRLTCRVLMAMRVLESIEHTATLAVNECDLSLISDLAEASREAAHAIDARVERRRGERPRRPTVMA